MSRAATWIATLGPVGWWPVGPGTLTSLAVAGAWWWVAPSRAVTLMAAAVLTAIGTLAATLAERRLGQDDGRIVIDEAAGMTLALAGVPAGPVGAAVAFLLFRALDIGKPPPVSWCERIRGGAGVMLDDVVAGALAAGIGAILFRVLPALGS